ncbi:MAG: hypothetical protein ACRD0M_07220 [Acidimicrobiales bacterium]
MIDPWAELSSLATALEDVGRRVGAIAAAYAAADRGDRAGELYEAERAVTAAQRRLAKLVEAERP